MILSIVIPAHNEEGSIRTTVEGLVQVLAENQIPCEILVINDHSVDDTVVVLEALRQQFSTVRWVENRRQGGFGFAVRAGLENFAGDAVCVVMADASDDPQDVVKYYRKLEEGYECVFGSRFMAQSQVKNYPYHKLLINRLANWFVKILFGLDYNDTTNAFKCYHRRVIEGVQPVLSNHFNLTVELPLKAIVRGYSYTVVPINWYGRVTGVSKLKIKEMGSRYLFIVLYIFLEKLLAQGDYHRQDKPDKAEALHV